MPVWKQSKGSEAQDSLSSVEARSAYSLWMPMASTVEIHFTTAAGAAGCGRRSVGQGRVVTGTLAV